MSVTSFFPIGCMSWQHDVILEPLWETDLNITHFPVQRTGRLTPLLTCLPYFSLLLGQNYSKSNSLSLFFFFGQKISKSNSSSLLSLGENFLSPILSPMEVEHCIRGDGEEIRNFLHRIKRTVDKGWPDDLNGIEAAQYAAERAAQGRQRRQRYIDYSLKGLRPKYLQRKAQEYLMENPNATWNDFSARIIQRDVSFQVSSNFLNDEEQTKAQMATLGQEMKNLRSELLEHRVNAVEGNSRTADPNQKGRQNATRFCNYCRTNGHTPSWCRKKIRDEELKRIENERTAEKKVTFTQDYNKKRGPDHGSEQWARGQDFQRRNQNFSNDRFRRSSPNSYQNFSPRPNLTYRNNSSNDRRSFDQRPNQLFNRNSLIAAWKLVKV